MCNIHTSPHAVRQQLVLYLLLQLAVVAIAKAAVAGRSKEVRTCAIDANCFFLPVVMLFQYCAVTSFALAGLLSSEIAA